MSVTYDRKTEVAREQENSDARLAMIRAKALQSVEKLVADIRAQGRLMSEAHGAMLAPTVALQKLLSATGLGGTELGLRGEETGEALIVVVIDPARQGVSTRWVDEVRQADWGAPCSRGALSSTVDENERAEISNAFNEFCEAVRRLTDRRISRVLTELVPEGQFAQRAGSITKMFASTLPKEVRHHVDRSLRLQLPVVAFLSELMSDLREGVTTHAVGRQIRSNKLLGTLLSFGLTLQVAAEDIVEPALRKIETTALALNSRQGLRWRADLLAGILAKETSTQPPSLDPVVRAIFLLTKELSGEQIDVLSRRLLGPIDVLERAGFSSVADTLQSLDPRELAPDGTEILGELRAQGTISDRILQMVFPEEFRARVVAQARTAERAVLTAELSKAMTELAIPQSYWPEIEGEADLTALRERCAVLQTWGTDSRVEVPAVLAVMPELLTVSEDEFLTRLSALRSELREVLRHMPASLSPEDLNAVRSWFTSAGSPDRQLQTELSFLNLMRSIPGDVGLDGARILFTLARLGGDAKRNDISKAMKRLGYEVDADSLNSSLTKLVREKIVHSKSGTISLTAGESGVNDLVAKALVAFVKELEDARSLFSRCILYRGGRV